MALFSFRRSLCGVTHWQSTYLAYESPRLISSVWKQTEPSEPTSLCIFQGRFAFVALTNVLPMVLRSKIQRQRTWNGTQAAFKPNLLCDTEWRERNSEAQWAEDNPMEVHVGSLKHIAQCRDLGLWTVARDISRYPPSGSKWAVHSLSGSFLSQFRISRPWCGWQLKLDKFFTSGTCWI